MNDNKRIGTAVSFIPVAGLVLALAAGAVAGLAGFGSRMNLWHFRIGFTILKWAAYGGLAAAVISFAGVLLTVKNGYLRSVVYGLAGIVLGGAVFVLPLHWRMQATRVPPIHDITTDIVHPPQFVTILPLRKDAPNPAAYGGPEVAIKQRLAYPDIQTLILNAPRPQAFEQALAAGRAMGWRIVATEPQEGRIEATDTTFWFGFKDDIVVRITAADEHRSLVDVRSVSRVGRSDVGKNAARIRCYLGRIKSGR
ncbi:MAG TPA: DUF1499 domain-containing protein [Geobacteraceae bacterium]|nr:DUF1499 domain-containing protein [Geobacteraceae bacterium]